MYVALSSIINQPPINLRYPKVRVIPNKPLTDPPASVASRARRSRLVQGTSIGPPKVHRVNRGESTRNYGFQYQKCITFWVNYHISQT